MSAFPLRLDSARTLADESYLRPVDRAGLSAEHETVYGLSIEREGDYRSSRYRVDVYGFSVPLPGLAGPGTGHAFRPLPLPAGLNVAFRMASRRYLPLPRD